MKKKKSDPNAASRTEIKNLNQKSQDRRIVFFLLPLDKIRLLRLRVLCVRLHWNRYSAITALEAVGFLRLLRCSSSLLLTSGESLPHHNTSPPRASVPCAALTPLATSAPGNQLQRAHIYIFLNRAHSEHLLIQLVESTQRDY